MVLTLRNMKPMRTSHLTPDIRVETRILGHHADTVCVSLPAWTVRVADLIAAKMDAECRALERGERTQAGRESMPPDEMYPMADRPPTHDPHQLYRSAIDGYRAGWYIILVDGEEPGGLDTVLKLSPDSRIAFVRVYPLPLPRERGQV